MRFVLRTRRARWLMIGLTIMFTVACSIARVPPATQIVEVTRVVRVPQIAQSPQIVEVTRVVPVTRIVQAPVIVEVTRLVEAPPIVVTVPVEVPAIEVTPVIPVTQAAPIGNKDLLVWYDFEGDFLTSGTIADRSGSGQDAQVKGTVDVAKGISGGQAIFFSGNGHLQAQSNPVVGRSTVSFSLWFKTDHPKANYKLASAAWWSGGPASGWVLATHIPEFWSDDTKSLYLPDISNNENYFPAGKWVHEVVTYDGEHIREFTNGQLVNDWPTTGAGIGQGKAMVVGAWPPFSAYDFQGSIDEFQVFARSLTLEEVQALYNQGQ